MMIATAMAMDHRCPNPTSQGQSISGRRSAGQEDNMPKEPGLFVIGEQPQGLRVSK